MPSLENWGGRFHESFHSTTITSVQELYISSNLVCDRRELFHLKPLKNLLILSLENNRFKVYLEPAVFESRVLIGQRAGSIYIGVYSEAEVRYKL